MELSQYSQISLDLRTKGFDLSAGKTWIYPENYPIREYQFDIVKACLYSNTLVCLPTGLGKTFIAAVVMYNFSRWYPCGKVVFLAPTKPLVAQQISACHNVMGIPSIETIELTGAVNQKQREVAWSKKRVFFATPQVFHNDLEKNIVPSDLVKCVVIDEAHKALGKHSYCECIRILSERNEMFRVLALSATPGNKIDNVHEVLKNLLIAHVELRDETSLDIVPYINRRKVDIILVPLNNELSEYKERYIFIMDRHVRVLLQYNVLNGHTANISKGRVFHLLREHQKKSNRSANYGQIMKTLNILMTMYHAYELMVRDGLRAFCKFYQNHSDKFWMNDEPQLQVLLDDINTYLGPFPDAKTLEEDASVNIPQNLVFGHTKFDKLKELLLHHFTITQKEECDSRAIVFVEYRDIVNEIYILLLQCQPLIRPQMFVGQAGQKQKQQIKALEDFRNNHVNVLISTSIGEEGLDVGEVDLIICFDVSQHSPTRLVQRMGRTGRKRDGHIIILVTDGREHETLKSTMARRDSLNHKVLNRSNIFSSLYQNNPRMIPDIFSPECMKMHINVQPKSPTIKRKNCKGKLDKRGTKRQNVEKKISTAETNLATQKDGSKFSMMKYLKGDQRKEHSSDTCKVVSFDVTQSGTISNAIKTTDVKILSCDNDAIDFLTNCAMSNSEKEGNTRNKHEVDQSHVPDFPLIEDFFNFTVPSIAILDCLSSLRNIVVQTCDENNLKNDDRNSYVDDSFSVNDFAFEDIETKIDEGFSAADLKFEDLLDDSMSDKSDILARNEEKLERTEAPVIFGTECQIDSLRNLESGKFEDVLNDTSDSAETNSNMCVTDLMQERHTSESTIYNASKTEQSLRTLESKDNIEGCDLQKSIVNHDRVPISQCGKEDENCEELSKNISKLNFCVSANRSTANVTKSTDEAEQLYIKSPVSKVVYDDSDDDMFQDEKFVSQMDKRSNFGEKTESFSEYSDRNNIDSLKDLKDQESVAIAELEKEEYEWDDDFEISISPLQSCKKFDARGNEDDRLTGLGSNEKTNNSDGEEWFSVQKSFGTSNKNDSVCNSIARKLANVRKSLNSSNSFNNRSDIRMRAPNASNKAEKTSSYFLNDSSRLSSFSFEKAFENRGKKMEPPRKRSRSRRLKKQKNEFVLDEAEVSSNNDSTTDGTSGTDEDLDGFVSYTQNEHDTSEMHAHYLQTIRSPLKKHHGFVFKQPRIPDAEVEIYSQPVTQLDESYLYDSFCVEGDENEVRDATRVEELSELEKAEQELKRRKRKRRCERNQEYSPSIEKKVKRSRRRNIINYSSSSEDETEKLRQQIQNDSLIARMADRNW